ncbi:MAG TPA: DUF2975 domain-containing protein [Steroidobacteraceae bacterium]|nr:DUF2975 domain-containing protein [Steroidobacteraceae bacterium]
MAESLTADLKEARALAGTARVFSIIALVIIGVTIAARLGPAIWSAVSSNDPSPWRDQFRDVGLRLISLLPAMLLFESVNQLQRALNLYCDGQFFSAAAASRVAQAGEYAVHAMIALILVVPNLTVWVSNHGGFRWHFEPEHIGMLAFALFVSVVGRILAAATRLKTENDSFV